MYKKILVSVDLVSMSTHGRSGLGRLVYGSVAEKVLQGASCPVLLIRAKGEY
jgi:nucleotide-binding universal stress UspA family protein